MNYYRCWLPDVLDIEWEKKIENLDFINKIYFPFYYKRMYVLKKEIIFFLNKKNTLFFIKNINKCTFIFKLNSSLKEEEYSIIFENKKLLILSNSYSGFLYAFYNLINLIQLKYFNKKKNFSINKSPNIKIRMINHLDNLDGSIDKSYSGNSIFFLNNKINFNLNKIKYYTRLLASININNICINNINVNLNSTFLITKKWLIQLNEIYNILYEYNIKLYISINYKSPIIIDNLSTYDPLDINVNKWWDNKIKEIYNIMPNFGGFVIKINSEISSGLLSYKRNHIEGSNIIAKPLIKFNGLLFWNCFIDNYKQDWRNRNIDRACYTFNNFNNLDGLFYKNVILQIKNGPIDFQVREPVSPLLGSMKKTSQILELQINQEYTGQQIDLCWLPKQWKEIFNFNTFYKKKKSNISNLISGELYPKNKYYGVTVISNFSNCYNWSGNYLTQSNLFCYGKLLWNLNIDLTKLLTEWIKLSLSNDKKVINTIKKIMLNSWNVYESYTSPLGLGWMFTPNTHYGPNIDGYEYSNNGTYHYSNQNSLGVDRTTNGTNFVSQYSKINKNIFNNPNTCPEKLLLFFHNLPYSFILKSKKTIIQHIYDSHFKGVKKICVWIYLWKKIEKYIPNKIFLNIKKRLYKQYINSKEWRDQINTYFLRKSGIKDKLNRKIHI